jgi:hypothetical protein
VRHQKSSRIAWGGKCEICPWAVTTIGRGASKSK